LGEKDHDKWFATFSLFTIYLAFSYDLFHVESYHKDDILRYEVFSSVFENDKAQI